MTERDRGDPLLSDHTPVLIIGSFSILDSSLQAEIALPEVR